MTVCPEDEVTIADDGEILINAPTCIMQGYYRDAEKTATAIRNGVLHTGDLGFFDENNLLHVKGRKKDVLMLPNGTKVFLPEYEAAIINALKEHDVAVMLCDNILTLACGKLASGHDEIMKAIEPAMATYPPGSRIGRIVHIGHALPRTAAGDIERWKLQKELDDGNC